MNLFKIINISSFVIITIGIIWSLYDVGFIPSMMVMVTGAALLMVSTINRLLNFTSKYKKSELQIKNQQREILSLERNIKELEKLQNRKDEIAKQKENTFSKIDDVKSNEELPKKFLSCICNDLKSVAGTIYWNEDKKLILKSTYGVNFDDVENKEYEVGDGITGQVAFDRKPISMEDIPEEYLTVKSGLGESKPTNILIYPLSDDEKRLLGVVEIATFHRLEDFEMEYLKSANQKLSNQLKTLTK